MKLNLKLNLKQKLSITLAIKMVVGFLIGYLIAELFSLNSSYTAGVITVLSMALTREEVLKNAARRGGAALIGLGIATLVFLIPMDKVYAIIVIALVLLPLLVLLRLEIGAVIALTLISQLYLAPEGELFSALINAIFILLIGIGVALILNLFHINVEEDVNKAADKIDQYFSQIGEIVAENKTPDFKEARKVHDEARDILNLAKANASREYFLKLEEYLRIRRLHIRSIEHILATSAYLSETHHKKVVMDFFKEVLTATGKGPEMEKMALKLETTYQYFAGLALPVQRIEFEERAQLFHILKELENFIKLEVDWHNKYDQAEIYPAENLV